MLQQVKVTYSITITTHNIHCF